MSDFSKPKILIDADACPSIIREILYRAAFRVGIALVFVSNKYFKVLDAPNISSVLVSGRFDAADDKIVELSVSGDLIITADIPLASRIVELGAFALNPRGTFYTSNNIANALSMRNLMEELRTTGVVSGGPQQFSKKDSIQFARELDSYLAKNYK